MAYKVKGKFYWVNYLDPINNDGYCEVNFTSNNVQYNSITCVGTDYVVLYDYDFVGNFDTFINEAYRTIDFGSEYQEINEWLYNLLLNKSTALDGGKLFGDIIINITSPNGVILATEKTIVNSNIKVTIDESLLGGENGYPVEATDSSIIINSDETGKIYKYIGETDDYCTNGYYYVIEEG